jgi:hypothetical protein
MGSCSSLIRPQKPFNIPQNLCIYPSKLILNIKRTSQSQDKQTIPTEVVLTKPLLTSIELIPFASSHLWVSNCIVPGQDPHAAHFKKCLDKCLYLYDDTSILLALFDGHGPEGERAVNFCCNYISKRYRDERATISVRFI